MIKINKKYIQHKFFAKKTSVDGIIFSSKLEAKWYSIIKNMKESGQVLFFLRQVPFHLPGNIIYRADFMLFFADGSVEIWESKGFETTDWKIKKRLVEAQYPIKIKVVK
jgi:hypothetical protein